MTVVAGGDAVVPVPPQRLAPGQQPPDRTMTDGGLITSSAAVVDGKVYLRRAEELGTLQFRV
jgi:hypothetical protein